MDTGEGVAGFIDLLLVSGAGDNPMLTLSLAHGTGRGDLQWDPKGAPASVGLRKQLS